MKCESLNITLCPVCTFVLTNERSSNELFQSKCWVKWWIESFEDQLDLKQYILNVLRTEGLVDHGPLDPNYFLYLKAAIDISHPNLSQWLDKVIILL